MFRGLVSIQRAQQAFEEPSERSGPGEEENRNVRWVCRLCARPSVHSPENYVLSVYCVCRQLQMCMGTEEACLRSHRMVAQVSHLAKVGQWDWSLNLS